MTAAAEVQKVWKSPKAGESVLVQHGSNEQSPPKDVKKGGYETKITAVYMDGLVRVPSGDLYKVRPSRSTCVWETVAYNPVQEARAEAKMEELREMSGFRAATRRVM